MFEGSPGVANTSVHFPDGLLEEIERRAAEAGISRNRFIVESCRTIVRGSRREWPADFFSTRLTAAERDELRASAKEFIAPIVAARRNRTGPPF